MATAENIMVNLKHLSKLALRSVISHNALTDNVGAFQQRVDVSLNTFPACAVALSLKPKDDSHILSFIEKG